MASISGPYCAAFNKVIYWYSVRNMVRYIKGGDTVTILNVTEARSKLYSLIDETTNSHQPVVITGKRGNAVLVSEEDWNSINETLYLLSVPGMRETLQEGMKELFSKCSKELDW